MLYLLDNVENNEETEVEMRAATEALRKDINFLGKILGETIRDVEGKQTFDPIKTLQKLSACCDKDHDKLANMLSGLSDDDMNKVTSAAVYFSILANIAEDHHHIQRWRISQISGCAPSEGSLEASFAFAKEQGFSKAQLKNFFRSAYIAPVLTAHPTEVQRRSILDISNTIAALLSKRDRQTWTKEEYEEIETDLRTQILSLWQTRVLRSSKLSVLDEVDNVLTSFETTFFDAVPKLYAAVERAVGDANGELPTFLQIASWVGGDRDGNPFVDATVLTQALSRYAERAMAFYIAEVGRLHAELSLTGLQSGIMPGLQQLVNESPDSSEHRTDEPYRLALATVQARLVSTYESLLGCKPPVVMSACVREAKACSYEAPEGFIADLAVIEQELLRQGSKLLAHGRLGRLLRTVRVFGWTLAPLDLRQNSVVHERVIAELIEFVSPGTNYLALNEKGRVEILLRELSTPRPLVSRQAKYSAETAKELAIFDAARSAHMRYGVGCIRKWIISMTNGVSDILKLALL